MAVSRAARFSDCIVGYSGSYFSFAISGLQAALLSANHNMAFSSDIENLTFEPDLCEVSEKSEYCVCGVPSTENLVGCNGPTCPIGFYHRQCVGLVELDSDAGNQSSATAGPIGVGAMDWLCEFCKRDEHRESSPGTSASNQSKHAKPSQGTSREPRAKFKLPTISHEEVISLAPGIMREAILQLTADELYQDTALGQKVISLAKAVLSSAEINTSACAVSSKLYTILVSAKDKVIGPLANTHIFREFHKFRRSPECDIEFGRIVGQECDETLKSYFQQYILRTMLVKLLKMCQGEESLEEENVPLSVHDEQVLRYIAGYIPYALLKKYRRTDSESSKKISSFILQWKANDDDTHADSFLEYTSVWITLQNRGGLFVVSDTVYSLFRAMEIVTRKLLKATAIQGKNETLKEHISKHVYGSVHVHNIWNALAGGLSSEESDVLLASVINYWIKLRIHSYVRSYVTMWQQSVKKAKGGKKALRKELKKQAEK